MPINFPPLKARPATLADWVEFRALSDPRFFFRLSRLKRAWDTHRESEDSDPGGDQKSEGDTDGDGVSGADEDAFLDAITEELSERATVLGGAYPFEISEGGLRFSVRNPLPVSGYCYIFCLLLSHPRAGDITNETWLPEIDHTVRDLFQACSTLAAAGHVAGCAISFGWPRPDNNPPFLTRLREVYALFGEGTVREVPLAGASPFVKDEEIDVIAWAPRPDAAGTTYLLGQVASGEDWDGKSVVNGIPYFHETWFSQIPASRPLASMFIPHTVTAVGEGTRRDRVAVLAARFGMIFDRLRLPELARKGIVLADEEGNGLYIERRGDVDRMVTWVGNQIKALRASGEAPV